MFEREGSAPDVLDVDDPAVRRCSPPVQVWVDLAALTQHRERGKAYDDVRPGGVFVAGLVRGVMWAQVMTGPRHLTRRRHVRAGAPRRTRDDRAGARAAVGPAAPAPGELPPDVRQSEQQAHRRAT